MATMRRGCARLRSQEREELHLRLSNVTRTVLSAIPRLPKLSRDFYDGLINLAIDAPLGALGLIYRCCYSRQIVLVSGDEWAFNSLM